MLKACEVVTVLQQLKDFLPCEVIDAHAHIYDASFTPALRGNSMFAKARQDAADCFNNIQNVMPGSACDRAVFLPPPEASFGPPLSETRMMNTRFIVHELEKNPASIGAAFVGPDDTIQNIEKMLVHERIRGLKCYFTCVPIVGMLSPMNSCRKVHGKLPRRMPCLLCCIWAEPKRWVMRETWNIFKRWQPSIPVSSWYLRIVADPLPRGLLWAV